MPKISARQLSKDIPSRLGSADLRTLLEAARRQPDFTSTLADQGHSFRRVMQACIDRNTSALSLEDLKATRARAAYYKESKSMDTVVKDSARTVYKVISAELALSTAKRTDLVCKHAHRQDALEVLESFWDGSTAEPGLAVATMSNGVTAIAAFELDYEPDDDPGFGTRYVDFLEKCKSLCSSDGLEKTV
jgi:hypothetical protein